MPGFTEGRKLDKIGLQGAGHRRAVLRRRPGSRRPTVLGEEGEAFGYLGHNLPQERLTIAVGSVAQARGGDRRGRSTTPRTARSSASRWPRSRTRSSSWPPARPRSRPARRCSTGRSRCTSRGSCPAPDAAQVKLFCTEMQARVVDRCLQLFGGYGYMIEYPIARLYADARVTRIYGGTSEVMKVDHQQVAGPLETCRRRQRKNVWLRPLSQLG